MSTNLPPRREPPPEEATSSEPSAPSKSQYSLDEMMKSLRDKEREKEEAGEVVTRSDGTIARKVKRRRRRTEQPNKNDPEKQRKRLLFKVVLAAVALLLLFLTGLFLIIFQNSKGYQEKLEQEASEWTGAEVELAGLKRLPFSVTMNEARFNWGADYFVKDLEMRKINGDVGFSAFLGARPSGLLLGGSSGEMTLQTPGGKWKGISLQEEEGFPFLFDQYICESLDVNFGDESPLAFKDLGVILSHEGSNGYQLAMDEGVLKLKGWEDLTVAHGLFRFNDGAMEMKGLSLEHDRRDGLTLGSKMELSGQVALEPGKQASLEITTERFPLDLLIGKQLARFLTGSVISSNGKILFTVGNSNFDEIELKYEGDSARMAGFPFLTSLENLFVDAGFDQLEFQEGTIRTPLSGTLRVRPSGMALEDLQMSRKGKVKLEGAMIIRADGSLNGRFDLALNRIFFTNHPKLRNSPLLAGTESTGYVKLSFPVSGTVNNPQDGFVKAIGMTTGVITPRPATKDKIDLWNELQKPEEEPNDESLDGTGLAPNGGIDLLPEGIRELENATGN